MNITPTTRSTETSGEAVDRYCEGNLKFTEKQNKIRVTRVMFMPMLKVLTRVGAAVV